MDNIETVTSTVIPPSSSSSTVPVQPSFSFCMHTRTVSSTGNLINSYKYTFKHYKY